MIHYQVYHTFTQNVNILNKKEIINRIAYYNGRNYILGVITRFVKHFYQIILIALTKLRFFYNIISEVRKMTKKERALLAVEALKKEYPEAICALVASNDFELLVATRLSAQCTDARVNLVTPALFAKYPTLEDYANADVADVEELIHSCGFFRGKARDIIGMAQKILSDFGGRVPDNIDDLTTLPGVGRKTANLICGDVYGKPAVVADTHLIRITNLLGLVDTKDPYKVELALKKLLPPEESNDFCHRVVLHGRAVCIARRPQCDKCCMADFCKSAKSEK